MKIGLSFGALAAPIQEQLAYQGVRPKRAGLTALWQRDADSITRLSVRGLLPDGQARAARQRLMKNIIRHSSQGE